MAPLPPNNTDILFIDYTSAGQRHTMDIRLAETAGLDGAVAMYDAVTAALKEAMSTNDRFLGARFSDAGSNVSFPLPVAGVQGTNGSGIDLGNKPNFVSLTGRSTDGRRVRFTFFSPMIVENPTYRTPVQPNAYIQNWWNALSINPGTAVTVSGLKPILNTYANVGSNAYFQRKARRSG